MIISCLATYFLELGTRFSLKVATKVFLDVKHLLKLRFLDYFSKAETEACYQNIGVSLKNWELLHLVQLHVI